MSHLGVFRPRPSGGSGGSGPGVLLGVPLIVLGAMALGVGLIDNAALYVPLTLELLLLGLGTWFLVVREGTRETRRWLTGLAIWAFLLRLVAFGTVHFVFSPYFFAPDALSYEARGSRLASYWSTGVLPLAGDIEGDPFSYNYLNAIFDYLLGDSAIALPILNLFCGVWTCLLVFNLSRRVLGDEYAKPAAVMTAVFPSLVLWSVLNIRDSLATMLVTALVLIAVKLRTRYSIAGVVGLLIGVFLLSQLRDYVAFFVVAGGLLGYFLSARPGRVMSTMVIGVIATVGLAMLLQRLDVFDRVVVEDPLAQMTRMRLGLQASATSAYGAGYDTTTLTGALRFLPLGISFLLFAPFPWAIESPLQLAAMPETLLWYPLFLMSLVGIRKSLGESRGWIPIAILIVLVSTYALVEGNFGTAYRHRAQFMPLFFIFAGVGLKSFKVRFEFPTVRRKGRMRSHRISMGQEGRSGPNRKKSPLPRQSGDDDGQEKRQ